MDAPTSLWIVLDPKSGPEFAAAWREFAHEHIKDCLDEGIHEASRWVVREYVPADEITRLRAEIEALRADAERLCWLIDTADSSWTVEMFETFETGEIRNVIDIAMSATAQLAR